MDITTTFERYNLEDFSETGSEIELLEARLVLQYLKQFNIEFMLVTQKADTWTDTDFMLVYDKDYSRSYINRELTRRLYPDHDWHYYPYSFISSFRRYNLIKRIPRVLPKVLKKNQKLDARDMKQKQNLLSARQKHINKLKEALHDTNGEPETS